jgi:predicted nucleic acid-binding protein
MAFVLDASLAAAWFLPDEQNEAADKVLASLDVTQALVPTLFWFEMRNLFLMAERRQRLRYKGALLSMAQLRALPVQDEGTGGDHLVFSLAERHSLSAYDASYLALAVDRALALGTADSKVANAAFAERIEILGPLAR